MKQNIYDQPEFFSRYSTMPRSTGGLEAAGEWHAFRGLLPLLQGKRVLDLGCGFGWHCRYAAEQGAAQVVGVDLSEKMLERARAATAADASGAVVKYVRAAIEDLGGDGLEPGSTDSLEERFVEGLAEGSFDVVISSLAFHYVEKFDLVAATVHRLLARGGAFVFSVEHPLFTVREAQDWHYDADGKRAHWPVDNYQDEGIRHARWLADDVVKYHRTLATYANTLIAAGFTLTKLLEPEPDPELLAKRPDLVDERRRPIFLLVAATAG